MKTRIIKLLAFTFIIAVGVIFGSVASAYVNDIKSDNAIEASILPSGN